MAMSAEDRLTRARMSLESRGDTNQTLVSVLISQSWERCLAAGLDPACPPALQQISAVELSRERDRVGVLRRLAMAEMGQLYQQIAGTNHMVAFASAEGLLLDTLADTTFLDTARSARISAGTIWRECDCGTNALGTTALVREPIIVHGPEHFFVQHRSLTCTAAPVFDPDGNLVGVIDASSDYRSRQQHTRALVTMAAMQIENGLLRERHGRQMIVAFHSRAEYVHTLTAGLLALDADGCILAVNPQARFLLHGLPATRGRHFDDIFRTRLRDVITAARDGNCIGLEDRVGSRYAGRLENAPARLAKSAVPQSADAASDFVAEDAAVAGMMVQVARAARRRVPVLVRGATGTGKEQFARYAHAASGRDGKFIPVNCAALPETLAEAELFGHAEGAFTGARRGGAPGLIAEAHGGTLFLDEIGDMKPGLQALLLRFLDDGTVRPVGGGRGRAVDALVIAATNVSIEAAIAQGHFRVDLFYRLSVLEVKLPTLAERTDFASIANFLLAGIDPSARLSLEALAVLAARPWPGNIRELRSTLTRLVLARSGAVIGADDVAAVLDAAPPRVTTHSAAVGGHGLRRRVRASIREMHAAQAGNVSATARALGISRNAVYRALTGPDAEI